MNAFQYVALSLVAGLAVLTFRGVYRGQMRKRVALLWTMLWSGAAAVIAEPNTTMVIARFLGIGRGTDLVLYGSVLLSLVAFFYIYTRFRRLDRQLTLLVRRLAVDNARSPDGGEGSG